YVPCAVVVLARFLEDFRREVDAPVFIATNGGYRSPTHRLSRGKDIHSWGTAANIYRIGNAWLDDADSIAKYGKIAESLSTQVFLKPYAEGDDHLHVDLGFITIAPRDQSEKE
ncbi:MAG: hypothetical protein LC627_05705, partial [Verrucomicrobiaceae bacterium]|nr:hypothetical protein [Verrucomicrobiaceae bacterium]